MPFRKPPVKYESLPEESSDNEVLLHAGLQKSQRNKQQETIRLLTYANVFLAALLLSLSVTWWATSLSNSPKSLYSPANEAVKLVNKRFDRRTIFRALNETSEELDQAWKSVLGPSDGIFQLTLSEAKKSPPSSEIYFEPGYYIYGLAMFHQMHCLDTIRRSFYPEHYFPNETAESVRLHKNHCLDVLRQSIMCYGDTSLVHWWNSTFTSPQWNGRELPYSGFVWTENYSPEYMAMSGKERAFSSDLRWDSLRQCRDFDSLYNWVGERQIDLSKA